MKHSLPEDEVEDVTCKNCNFTTLPSLCNIKLVAQLVIKRTINLNVLQRCHSEFLEKHHMQQIIKRNKSK